MTFGTRSTRSGASGKKGMDKVEETAARREAEALLAEESWQSTNIKKEQIMDLVCAGFLPEEQITQCKISFRRH